MSCRGATSAGIGLALLCAATAGSVQARSPHDGTWSVLIVTESGNCDRAYRYAVRVEGGVLRSTGDAAIRLDGRVTGSGHVRVTIGRGEQSASGTGRLLRDSGAGTWRGRSSRQQCRGRWVAERR